MVTFLTNNKSKSYGTWSGKMPFPPVQDCIFIDIETNVNMKKVWLIGVKHEKVEKQYIAYNWHEEVTILNQLAGFLAKYPGKALICYSTTNFDFRVLQLAAKRNAISNLIEQFQNRALIDMGTLLRRYYTPYGGSYSLKMLRFLVGYKYDDISISGEDVAIEYYKQVKKFGKITNEFADKALRYNLDDIRVLDHLVSTFEGHISFTGNFTENTTISEVRDLLNEVMYSKNINSKFVRITIYKDHTFEVMGKLMSQGLPLPEVKEGVYTSALYWKSRFAFNQAEKVVNELVGSDDLY